MPRPGKIFVSLLIALAGCSTAPRDGAGHRAPDWTASWETNRQDQAVERVPEPPRLAAPPAAAGPAVTAPPAAPPSNSFAETWIPLGRWSREHQAGTLSRIASASPVFALTTSNGVLIVQANSRVAKWNGVELHFGFEPQLIDEQPFVHALDLAKNIEPLLDDFTVTQETNRVIVIDPGHGGEVNPGASNVLGGSFEKEFTLDWAKRLEPLLAAGGWQVFLTRTNDADIPLTGRVAFAEEHQADLFVSLHFNSVAPNREQAGLETFCLTPTGMPSTLTRGFPDVISLVFTNNSFDEANLQYALRVHRALLQAAGMPDRGVRRARFPGVLRGQNRPAILIEGGYLSNPQEARRIADPAYRQKLAEAVAAALVPPPREAEPMKPEPTPQTVGSQSTEAAPRNPTPAMESSNSPATNNPLH